MNTPVQEEVKKYELMVIFAGDMLEVDFEKQFAEIRQLLKENSKNISYESNWGRRDLTYKIKKQIRGYYVVFNFVAEPKSILEIRSAVKLNQTVLRHMLVSIPMDYDTEKYQNQVLKEEVDEAAEKEAVRRKEAARSETSSFAASKKVVKEEAPKAKGLPSLVGKEEAAAQLKTVEKKLEKILENPDIDIR